MSWTSSSVRLREGTHVRRTYCDWKYGYGKIRNEPYPEEEARRRFESGERCTLLVGRDIKEPRVVLQADLCGARIEVTWLDTFQRPELMYLFVVQKDADWPKDKLLLEQTRISMYDTDERPPGVRAAYNEYYAFHADGKYYGTRGKRDGVDVEETTGQLEPEQLDLQIEPVPAFGEWDSLLRQER